MTLACAILVAVALDLAIGDPETRWHPVRGIGRCIAGLEHGLRAMGMAGPAGGAILVILTIVVSAAPVVFLMVAVKSPALKFSLECVVIYYSIALGSLIREGRSVRAALVRGDIAAGRAGVARLCGRDVQALDESGLTLATVESVVENSVDGFTAPIFYAALFGPAGSWIYRIANTLDSMVGYKNERYARFGKAAARLDDVLNWIPARITGVLISICSPIARGRVSNGLRTMWTYAPLHASPNAGWTESAAAGALDLRLGGPANYFGERVEKAYLGTGTRTPEPDDVKRAERLVLCAGLAFAGIACVAL